MDPSNIRYTPDATPTPLRAFLSALVFGGVCTGLFFKNAAKTFGLSLGGLMQGKFWQMATYPFVLGAALSWWSLLFLALEVLFLWVYSASIIEQKGIKSYLFLIGGSTVAAGIAAISLQSSAILVGMAPLFFAVLVAWQRLHPGASLLMLGFSIRATLLIYGFIGFDLLIHLAQEDSVPLAANSAGAIFGYLYSKVPAFGRKRKIKPPAKIYDIRSGRLVMDDDKFMDAMLARISLHGESSLTPKERKRMQEISERTRQEEDH